MENKRLSLWEQQSQRRAVIAFLNDIVLFTKESEDDTNKRMELYDEIYQLNREIKEHEYQIIKKREQIKELNDKLEEYKVELSSR
jgi:predicted  nucleic acid-binding Zn-ribbon protein